MSDNDLIKILKTFTTGETKEFKKFIASPFFNNRTAVIKYYDFLHRFHPDFPKEKIKNENAFKFLYPRKKFKDSVIRRLSSFLNELSEKFILYNAFENNTHYYNKFFTTELLNRRLNSLFEKKVAKIDKEYENFSDGIDTFFLMKYHYTQDKMSNHMMNHDDHLLPDLAIDRINNSKLNDLILTLLNLRTLYVNEKNFKIDYSNALFTKLVDLNAIEKFILHLEEIKHKYYPIIAIHFYEVMAFKHPENEIYYKKFRELISKTAGKFSQIERLNFYSMLEGVCMLKVESGNLNYLDELFSAYKEMLNKKLYSFTKDGSFVLKIFRNILILSAYLGEIKWLESFLKKYSAKLPAGAKDSMHNLSKAIVAFEKKEFEKSLGLLSKIDYEMFYFKIDLKNLQLKLFYELGYFEQALSLIDTYRHFLKNDRVLSERSREKIKKFLELAKTLVSAKMKNDKFKFHKLRKSLDSFNDVFNKKWLYEKVSAF